MPKIDEMNDEEFEQYMNKAINDENFDSGEPDSGDADESTTGDEGDNVGEGDSDTQATEGDEATGSENTETDTGETEINTEADDGESTEQSKDTNDDGDSKDSDTNTSDTDNETDDTKSDPDGEAAGDEKDDGSSTDQADETEGQSDKVSTESKTESETKEAKYAVTADGTELELNLEELIKLAPQALNYTRKMQEIAPYRKMISAIKDEGITEEDLNLALDILKGDKDAITTLIKQKGIDTIEIDTEKDLNYTPKSYGKSPRQLDFDEVQTSIQKDPEYKITQHVVNNQWDDNSRELLFKHPKAVEGLHADVKSGVFDKVSPRAIKLKALDGGTKSDLEYYLQAGQEYTDETKAAEQAQKVLKEQEEAKKAQAVEVEKAKLAATKQANAKKAAEKRKAAATTKKAATKANVMDYLDTSMSDEEFSEMMEKRINKI